MLVHTKYFGDIDLEEDKILHFENGIMGFEDCKRYTILFDSEAEKRPVISWLQSCDEQALALPVINPLLVKADYNPIVNDELLAPLGELNDDNLVVLLTLTVPADLTKMTANLKAPIVINADTKKGGQVVAENADYIVKYEVYTALRENNEGKGEQEC